MGSGVVRVVRGTRRAGRAREILPRRRSGWRRFRPSGISTATSSRSMASGGMPVCSWPSTAMGALPRRRQVRQPDCFLGEFDPHDAGSRRSLLSRPLAHVPAGPVHAGGTPQRVPPGQRLRHPRQAGHCQAGADRITRAQERTEVGPVHRPQRRGDQVIPAAMPAGSALPGDITRGPDPDPGAAHRPGKHSTMERQNPALLIVMVLCGAPGPSPENQLHHQSSRAFSSRNPRTYSLAAAGAARRRRSPTAGPGSGRPPDGGSGSESAWNLGDLVNDLKQVSKLIGRGIGTDVDRITDARGLPGVCIKPACRGHADSFHLDA